MRKKICIGTRGSKLALWQANFIKSEIERLFPDINVDLKIIKTKGDKITDRPLAMVGGKGLFVKEIEADLLNKDIDLAVHSMKDMPGELPEGLIVGAIPERANPFDILIAKDNCLLNNYKKDAVIGTSSLRRASQIKHIRPDVQIKSIRGNLDTRINKLKSGEYDAIVLAAAGLIRLGQADAITEYLDEAVMLPAVGQGALCIETRLNDNNIAPIMEKLDHHDTRVCVTGERAFLKQIEGSCHIPVACFAKIENSRIENNTIKNSKIILAALVASEDGTKLIKKQIISSMETIENAGKTLADTILEDGGRKILETLDSNE
jgi:hydroxymethylbilane synthase